MKQLYLTLILVGLANTSALSAADDKAVDPADITLGGLQSIPTRQHIRTPILGTLPLTLEAPAAKTTDFAAAREDFRRTADADRARSWREDSDNREELYEREIDREIRRGRAGLRDLDIYASKAIRNVTEMGRVVQKLHADHPYESAPVAQALEKQAVSGYRKWRKANPDKELYLYTQPAAPVGEPAVSIADLLRLGSK